MKNNINMASTIAGSVNVPSKLTTRVAIQVLNFKGHNNFVVCLCLIIRWLFVLLILVNHHCLHNLSFHNIGLVCKIKVVRPSRSTYIGDRLNKWYVFQSYLALKSCITFM
jgi:hypothetical protein